MMAFKFEEYEKKYQGMTTEELHAEWENYNREVLAKARSIATSVLLSPLTAAHTALARKGGILGKAYEYYRKNSTDKEGLQKHGYEPTPLAVGTSTFSVQNLTEQVETLDIEQDLSNYYATPHVGLRPTPTWPANYQAHLLNQGAGQASDAKAHTTKGGVSRSMSIKSITIRNGQNKPATMTIEEETLFIRGRLLQLEMLRRGDESQVFDQNGNQAQQTTELEVLVEDQISENTESDEVYTSFNFWNESPVQQAVSLAPPPLPIPAYALGPSGYASGSQGGTSQRNEQIYPTISQQVVCPLGQNPPVQNSAQVILTPVQTIMPMVPEYQSLSSTPAQYQYSAYSQEVIPNREQTTPYQGPSQLVTKTTRVVLPTVPEYQTPLSPAAQHQNSSYAPPNHPLEQAPAQNQNSSYATQNQPQNQILAQYQNITYTISPQAQEQRPATHRKESQDSGYHSVDSTPTAFAPAPPSFGLPPTAELPYDEEPDDFNPQDFGLPPDTVTPSLSDQHHIEPILSASALSPVVERNLDFQPWAPPETSQRVPPESEQTKDENIRHSLSSTSRKPRLDCHGSQPYLSYGESKADTAPSISSTSPIAEGGLDFQSWIPPETSQRALPEPLSVREKNARYSVSAVPTPKQDDYDSQAYRPYKSPDVLAQTYRDTRSQSVPMFPWNENQDSRHPFSPISPVPEQEPRYIAYSPS